MLPMPLRPATACLIAALLLPAATAAGAAGDPPREPCAVLRPIAPDVYLWPGRDGEPDTKNRGRTANAIALRGSHGWVVVDPGPSRQAGKALRCGLRRLAPLPVAALINTHPHPENVLANIAFPGVPIYASSDAAQAMRGRCARCFARLRKAVGARALAGTRPVLPDQTVATVTEIAPGGRALRLLPLGSAHSPGDLAVLDRESGTLIVGDAGNPQRLPDLRDGQMADAIAAFATLLEQPARRVVGSRGGAHEPTALAPPLAYLRTLWALAGEAVRAGEYTLRAPMSEYASLGGHAGQHALNLQHAYREAEELWWREPQSPAEKAASGAAEP